MNFEMKKHKRYKGKTETNRPSKLIPHQVTELILRIVESSPNFLVLFHKHENVSYFRLHFCGVGQENANFVPPQTMVVVVAIMCTLPCH